MAGRGNMQESAQHHRVIIVVEQERSFIYILKNPFWGDENIAIVLYWRLPVHGRRSNQSRDMLNVEQ
jgi:hypothetical protein